MAVPSNPATRLSVGSTFLNQNPGSPEHLWIVVAGPTDGAEFVIFNLTTWKDGCDESCIVRRGDHPFVTHDSFIAYARGQILSTNNWILLQRYGCTIRDPVSPELLDRIRHGALASDFTPQKLQRIVQTALLP